MISALATKLMWIIRREKEKKLGGNAATMELPDYYRIIPLLQQAATQKDIYTIL